MFSSADLSDVIVLIDHDNGRFVTVELFGGHQGIADDDDDITGLDETGSSTVEADGTGASLAADDVRFQSCAVVVVDDLYLFVRADTRCIEEIFIDGDATHVVEVCFGYGSAMDFGFECF